MFVDLLMLMISDEQIIINTDGSDGDDVRYIVASLRKFFDVRHKKSEDRRVERKV